MNKEIDRLTELKFQHEIQKIELEKKEINRKRWQYWITTLVPIIIATISAIVVLKSNLFQDLQVKIDNQKAEFKTDTINFAQQKRSILAGISKLISDSSILQDSIKILTKKVKFLDSTNRQYLKNSTQTLSKLETDNINKTNTITQLLGQENVNERLIDSMRNAARMNSSAVQIALFDYYNAIIKRIGSTPIRNQNDDNQFIYWAEEYYQRHMYKF